MEDTVTILRGLKEKYEVHHGVRIGDQALVTAAALANRYMTERKMPDKAIDLVDEAASRLRLQQESKPEPIWRLERKIVTKRIEMASLERETDAGSAARLTRLEADIGKMEGEMKRLTDVWMAEKADLSITKGHKEQLEALRRELEECQRRGDYGRAGELTHQLIPELEETIESVTGGGDDSDGNGGGGGGGDGDGGRGVSSPMLGDQVTAEHVAEVVAMTTGIPVSNLLAGEQRRLLDMEQVLSARVVGQVRPEVCICCTFIRLPLCIIRETCALRNDYLHTETRDLRL